MPSLRVVLLTLLAIAGCSGGGNETVTTFDSQAGESNESERDTQWDALHKVGNWWSVEEGGGIRKYEVVQVDDDAATISVTSGDETLMLHEEDISLRKPRIAGDIWIPEADPRGFFYRELDRGEEKVGEHDCYWVEYEIFSDSEARTGQRFVDKVWRLKKYGVVIKMTQSGKEFLKLRELHLK